MSVPVAHAGKAKKAPPTPSKKVQKKAAAPAPQAATPSSHSIAVPPVAPKKAELVPASASAPAAPSGEPPKAPESGPATTPDSIEPLD